MSRRSAFAILLLVVMPFTLAAQNGKPRRAGLDPALLTRPPVDAWPTYHGDYSGRRYSTLKQITPANVGRLGLAWVYRLNTSVGGAIVEHGGSSSVIRLVRNPNGELGHAALRRLGGRGDRWRAGPGHGAPRHAIEHHPAVPPVAPRPRPRRAVHRLKDLHPPRPWGHPS